MKWLLLFIPLSTFAQFEYESTGPLKTEFDSTKIVFTNNTKDTIRLSNVIPFTKDPRYPYITGLGNHPLSRTHLFYYSRAPINVIVPDNAWELGFNTRPNLAALTRRDVTSIKKGERKRFETILYPGGSVKYDLHYERYKGYWQDGLRIIFQDRKLYDLKSFDSTLYKRKDLEWMRSAYVMHLMMAWDKEYPDLVDFVKRGKDLYGGDDVICLWPTWPTLGIDQRNQFDMYRDLPGGLKGLKALSDSLHALGTKFFIAYNPWDESTRKEDHLKGLADLIRETGADGVVLDTKGESSKELQAAADAVKPGVIMYSEGMAVPKDMENIVSGRVHNALYHPPMLNLNKLINPQFSIFRVAEVNKEPIKREYAVAFFNGYGTEINQFAPGHPDWETEQYKFLGRTSMILRENSKVFTDSKLSPLEPTVLDSIWINKWEGTEKTLYTVFCMRPKGHNGFMLGARGTPGRHLVDLWHHKDYTLLYVDPFNERLLGTNDEGEVTCIADLPVLLETKLTGFKLSVKAPRGTQVRVWKGDPAYSNKNVVKTGLNDVVDLKRYEGKVVVQLFDGDELLDENVIDIKAGVPRLVSDIVKTPEGGDTKGMKKIPAGIFRFQATHGDEFISYPPDTIATPISISSFMMDETPVTNEQFYEFIKSTSYKPVDFVNYLKNWKDGRPAKGEERYPVVYISLEDARAYAKWAGKRLPTEVEWQYAAQTSAGNVWPWKQAQPDNTVCNMGDGKLYPVGKFKNAANPYGLLDLSGCVWQLTNDVYESGSYAYIIMKGGSYFKPTSSWWYVQGGPRELHYRQFLLRVSQGFERNGTVGFRCVKDL
ncbi:MAG TPA: formylglycine-generating enzyme family protein [Cyclobacteriaceae bacterium]|nr:formylglycine-generating enzyme family protein [Cyclobacteriaceae bacterium]